MLSHSLDPAPLDPSLTCMLLITPLSILPRFGDKLLDFIDMSIHWEQLSGQYQGYRTGSSQLTSSTVLFFSVVHICLDSSFDDGDGDLAA